MTVDYMKTEDLWKPSIGDKVYLLQNNHIVEHIVSDIVDETYYLRWEGLGFFSTPELPRKGFYQTIEEARFNIPLMPFVKNRVDEHGVHHKNQT